MKVELDLSTEQLESLDKDLTNVLNSLNEEQKIEILKSYINNKFNKMERTYTNSWGDTQTELTEFGKDLIKGLQEQITTSVTSEIMDNETLRKNIEDICNNIINNLEEIIHKAISTYVVDHLFTDKGYVQDIVRRQISDTIYDMKSRGVIQ